jgi:hypothetical protein
LNHGGLFYQPPKNHDHGDKQMKVFSTGARKGKTFTWKSHAASDVEFNFVDGVCDLYLYPQNELPGVLHYLRLNLQVKTEFEVMVPTPAGSSNESPQVVETDPIRLAILELDPDNDDNWTPGGLATVSALAGQFANIKRAQIDAVASDLTREVVRGK